MADLVACPTCQAMLRIPPDAPMIRCPQCKTVLAVNAPTARPLPFDPVPVLPPPPPLPTALALPTTSALPIAKTNLKVPEPIRKAVAAEDDVDPSVYNPNDRRSRRKMESLEERPYEELDEDERKARRKFERLHAQCRPGQIGMQVLGWGYRVGAFGYFALAAAGLMLTVGGAVGTLTYLIAGLNALFALISTIGLGFCCAGPKGMRGSAIVGTIVGVLSCILAPIAVSATADAFRYNPLNPPELYESKGEAAVAHYASLAPTHMLPQIPGLALANKDIPWLAILAGILELVRNFFVCAVARHYAEEGKDPDLGYRANRYLFRLMVIMTVITVMATAGWAMEQRGWFVGGQRYDYLFLAITVNLGVDTLLVSVAAQSQALLDIAEITDARRFSVNQSRLDTV